MLLAKRGCITRRSLGTSLCFAVDRLGAAPMLNKRVDVRLPLGGVAAKARQLFRPFEVFGVGGDLLADAVDLFEFSFRSDKAVPGNRERSRPRSRSTDLFLEHVAQALDSLLGRYVTPRSVCEANNRVAHLLGSDAALTGNLEELALRDEGAGFEDAAGHTELLAHEGNVAVAAPAEFVCHGAAR